MSDSQFLKLFLEEPIYVIPEDISQVKSPTPELIDVAESEIVEEPKASYVETRPIPVKGKNLKNCVVIVHEEAEIISAESEAFLLKILGAVNRKQDDFIIANMKDIEKEAIAAFLVEHNARQVLVFEDPSQHFSQYEKYAPKEGERPQHLLCDSLLAISEDKEKKKALWSALQSIFLN